MEERINSVDKYGSCGVPWWTALQTAETPSDEQMRMLTETVAPFLQTVIDAVLPVVQQLADALVAVVYEGVSKVAELLPVVWEQIWTSYPDRRVVHLALYHKKERVRKKNYNRIMKWLLGVEKDG